MKIQLFNVSKLYQYNRTFIQVLSQINFVLTNGDFLFLTGASGSGKSTLLKILTLTENHTSGFIEIKSKNTLNFTSSDKNKYKNKMIGVIPQVHLLLNDLSILENLLIPLLIHRYPLKKSLYLSNKILQFFLLLHRKFNKPFNLSGGEIQLVSIARALINKPDFIFADEPTGNLDKLNSLYIINYLINLHKYLNLTLFIISHNKFIISYGNNFIILSSRGII